MITNKELIPIQGVRMLAWGIGTLIRRIGVSVWEVGLLKRDIRRVITFMIRLMGAGVAHFRYQI